MAILVIIKTQGNIIGIMCARACAVTIKIGSVSADLCDKQSIYHVISTVAYEYSGFSICVERLKLAS